MNGPPIHPRRVFSSDGSDKLLSLIKDELSAAAFEKRTPAWESLKWAMLDVIDRYMHSYPAEWHCPKCHVIDEDIRVRCIELECPRCQGLTVWRDEP